VSVTRASGTQAATDTTSDLSEKEQEEQLQMLTLTLLQRIDAAEEIIAEGHAGADLQEKGGTLDLEAFGKLLDKLELGATPSQVKSIFQQIDVDGSGDINVSELKSSVRNSGVITDMYRDSLTTTALTLVPTGLLAAGLAYFKGASSGLDFLTAYVVEDSLSVDNLFVFLVLFKYFKVPPLLQTFCLNVGIFGAVVLRAFFIFAGLAAVKSFQPVLIVFALFLIYSAYNLLAGEEEDDEEEGVPDLVQGILDKIPTTDKFDGDKLFIKGNDGGFLATPLALCIIAVELSDILFAVDSIPAVFAVTEDPLIVYTSNIAAILGLRSLYRILSIAVQDLVYLEKSVALVLGFVGVKLAAEVAGFEISSLLSLTIIISTLGIGVAASLAKAKEEEDD
jgi:TerC family integral membrane protein